MIKIATFIAGTESMTLTEEQLEELPALKSLLEFSSEDNTVDLSDLERPSGIEIISTAKFFFNYHDELLDLNKNQLYILELLGKTNIYNYPQEYFDIYQKEKWYRELNDFDHLINVTNKYYKAKLLPESIPSISKVPELKFLEVDAGIKIINDLIKLLQKHRDNVVIAGGAALYYNFRDNYTNRKYKRDITFDDIDLFIHSCDEAKARDIVQGIIGILSDEYIINNENAIEIHPYFPYSNFRARSKKIQIIKRIYRSPSEIIHGFDIDCCCILLTFDKQIWATERCLYAIKHYCNTINFERLSPSYEYRLMKYFYRGFDLLIPQYNYFRKHLIGNLRISEMKGANILLYYLITQKKVKNISDYLTDRNNVVFKGIRLVEVIQNMIFKTLNPQEQTNNSFTQIVLEEPRLWYPNPNVVENFIPPIFNNDDIIKLDNVIQITINSPQVLCLNKRKLTHNIFAFPYKEIIPQLLKKYDLIACGDVMRHILFDDRKFFKYIHLYKLENISIIDIVKTFIQLIKSNIRDILTRIGTYRDPNMSHIEIRNWVSQQDPHNIQIIPIAKGFTYENFEQGNNPSAYIEGIQKAAFDYLEMMELKNLNCLEIRFQDLRNINDEFIRSNFSYQFPHLIICNRVKSTIEDMLDILNEQKIDFNRLLYDGTDFYTDSLGHFAITHKIHFTSNYKGMMETTNSEYYLPKIEYEKDGYTYYDPYLIHQATKRYKDI